MSESSHEESLLSLLGEDIAFSLIDPISKGIVSVLPDSVFHKIAEFQIANPWFAFVRGKVMVLVRVAAMKAAKLKLGGTVSADVEKGLNDKLDDVVNGVIRKVDELVKERTAGVGTPGAHGSVAAKPGDMLVIKIGSTRWLHGSGECYILQDSFDDNTIVEKVVEEEDDKSQQNQQGKKKGNQNKKKVEKTITRIPPMKTRTAEQAARGLQDGDYRVCPNPACGARERIAEVVKKDASIAAGLPTNVKFDEFVGQIASGLSKKDAAAFRKNVTEFFLKKGSHQRIEIFAAERKGLTAAHVRLLFIDASDADREKLLREADDAKKAKTEKERIAAEAAEAKVKKEALKKKAEAKHHEEEQKLTVQKKLMEVHGFTKMEAAGDRSETPNTFWQTWPFSKIWDHFVLPDIKAANALKAARVAAAARAPHP